jgi:hypothetical protein
MTNQEIDNLVAEKVMDWELGNNPLTSMVDTGWIDSKTGSWTSRFKPSTNISDAWQVVEKLRKDFDIVNIVSDSKGYLVQLENEYPNDKLDEFLDYKFETEFEGDADTAPMAICKAALNAVNA